MQMNIPKLSSYIQSLYISTGYRYLPVGIVALKRRAIPAEPRGLGSGAVADSNGTGE
jgi:hypothetical protein